MTFYKIELHPDSREITTFAVPDDLYRYTRLLFVVNMATKKFQKKGNNFHDDILVIGKDEREHGANLEKTLQKLEECGLTLKYECLVGVNSIAYMGDIPLK